MEALERIGVRVDLAVLVERAGIVRHVPEGLAPVAAAGAVLTTAVVLSARLASILLGLVLAALGLLAAAIGMLSGPLTAAGRAAIGAAKGSCPTCGGG